MENLKILISDFSMIKKYYFLINYYSHVNNQKEVDYYVELISEIYKKYSTQNYNDLIDLISNVWLNFKIDEDIEFCRNIIFLINEENQQSTMVYDDSIFIEIYKFIINNNLYNPNWNIGTSEEPLFVMLPVCQKLFETNMLVYDNDNIDWNILNNGSDAFMSFVYLYLNAKDNKHKEYYFEILKKALNKIDNIDNNLRYKSESKIVKCEIESIRKSVEKLNDDSLKSLFKLRGRRL